MIISEYDVKLVPGKGRSGMAIMVKDNASVWRVPPQYSGTYNDNWLTRSIVDTGGSYTKMISSILEKELA